MSVAAQRYGTWKSVLINAFWVPLHFQDTALIAISVPAALLTLAPRGFFWFQLKDDSS